MPDPISAGIAAIPAIYQTIAGIFQNAKGRKMLKGLERPKMNIPGAAQDSYNRALGLASTFEMPGQTGMQQNIDQNFANTAENINQTATSGPEALAALIGADANKMQAQNDLSIAQEQSYMNRVQNLQNQGNMLADWQDRQWQMNMLAPYQDKAATASSLIGAGNQNTFGGINTMSGIGANLLNGLNGKSGTTSGANSLLNQVGTSNKDTQVALPDGLDDETKKFLAAIEQYKANPTLNMQSMIFGN